MKTATDIETPVVSIVKPTKRISTKDIAKLVTPKRKKISDLVKARKIELNVSKGSDPELFIFDLEQNRVVSSIPILKRDKHNPIVLGAGYQLFADNVLMEASIPPSDTNEGLIDNLKKAFVHMQEQIGDRYRIYPKPAHTLDADQLVMMYDINPDEIGCTPSFCAYDLAVVTPEPFMDGMRSSSFHIHLGAKELTNFAMRIKVIKLLDVFAGCGAVLYDRDPSNIIRRSRYGAAGNHRCPVYGAEYRVLSGGTLKSVKTVQLALDLVDYALDHVRNGTDAQVLEIINADSVRQAINTCNVDMAEGILTKAGLSADLMKRVKTDYSKLDMVQEWGLK